MGKQWHLHTNDNDIVLLYYNGSLLLCILFIIWAAEKQAYISSVTSPQFLK